MSRDQQYDSSRLPVEHVLNLRTLFARGRVSEGMKQLEALHSPDCGRDGVYAMSFIADRALEGGDLNLAYQSYKAAYECARNDDRLRPFEKLDLLCDVAGLKNQVSPPVPYDDHKRLQMALEELLRKALHSTERWLSDEFATRIVIAGGEAGCSGEVRHLLGWAFKYRSQTGEERDIHPALVECMRGNELSSRISLRGKARFADAREAYESAFFELQDVPAYSPLKGYIRILSARLARSERDQDGVKKSLHEAADELMMLSEERSFPLLTALTLGEISKNAIHCPELQDLYTSLFCSLDNLPLRFLSSALIRWCSPRVLWEIQLYNGDEENREEARSRFARIVHRAQLLSEDIEGLSGLELCNLDMAQALVARNNEDYPSMLKHLTSGLSRAIEEPSALKAMWPLLLDLAWYPPTSIVETELTKFYQVVLEKAATVDVQYRLWHDLYGHLVVGFVRMSEKLCDPDASRALQVRDVLRQFLKKIGDDDIDSEIAAEIVRNGLKIISNVDQKDTIEFAELLKDVYLHVKEYAAPTGSYSDNLSYLRVRLRLEKSAKNVYEILGLTKQKRDITRNIHKLRRQIKQLHWENPDEYDGLL